MSVSLALLALGWFLFGTLHSLLVERRVQSRLRLPAPLLRAYRLAYNLLTAAAIAGLIVFASRMGSPVVYEAEGALRIPFHVLRAVGAVVGVGSAWQLGMLEFLGVAQLLGRVPASGRGLRIDGLYAICRHPMGLGFLLMLWCTPWMSAAYLVTAVALTAYLLVGSWFEERDLRRDFPVEYAAYSARVPTLIPAIWRLGRPAAPVTPAVPVERAR